MQITVTFRSWDEVIKFARDIQGLGQQPEPDDHVNTLLLPVYLRNALVANGLETAEKLSKTTALDLLRIPNVGRRAVDLISRALQRRGLSLQEE